MIHDLVFDNNLDILCITETWLGENDTAAITALTPDTHIFFNCPRPSEGRGGGVAVIITKAIKSAKVVKGDYRYFECMELTFFIEKTEYKIFTIYRAPDVEISSFFEEFMSFLIESKKKDSQNLYVGDFNFWVNKSNDPKSSEFLSLLASFGLANFVVEPTHESGNTLDLVIAEENNNLVEKVKAEQFNTISDHNVIFFEIKSWPIENPHKTIYFRNKEQLSGLEFSAFLKENVYEVGLESCVHQEFGHCVDCFTMMYNSKTKNFIDKTAPLVEKKILIKNRKNGWYNSETRHIKKELRKAEKKAQINKTESNIQEYKRKRSDKCALIRRQKCLYFNKIIGNCSNDMKALSNTLNNLLGKSQENSRLPLHTDEKTLANDFKDYFVDKIEKISSSFKTDLSPKVSYIPDFPTKFFDRFRPVDDALVENILNSMNKTNCLADPYDIKLFQLSEVRESLIPIFTNIINESFRTGIFPEECKTAIVRPLIKSNKDPDLLSSYRPVHNLSILSKIIEIVCLKQFDEYISNFEFLPKTQSAYRKDHSVETITCKIYDDLIISKSNGRSSLIILLDQTAAFDTVDTDIMLSDLKIIGVEGNPLNWFESYLKRRKFMVQVGKEVSELADMNTGIPQGSVLAPKLFSVYTAELYYILDKHKIKSYYYADDTQLVIDMGACAENEAKIQDIFVDIQRWMNGRKLKLNIEKTEAAIIHSNRQDDPASRLQSFTVDNQVITPEPKVRSLGVLIDCGLTMKDQLNQAKKKSIFGLINIHRIATFIDRSSRIKLVHGLVLCHIDFCNSLYFGLPNRELKILQLIINNSARMIEGISRFSRERITPINISLHFLPIKARLIYKICLLAYKAIEHGQPRYLAELLQPLNPTRTLRSSENCRLYEPIISTSAYSNRCFSYCAPRLYNALSQQTKSASNVAIFKNRLKTELFQKAYNMDTFTIEPNFDV